MTNISTNIIDEVDKLLDGLVKVKKEVVNDYSESIKNKIFEDMDEDEYAAKKYLNDSKLLNVEKFHSSKKEDLQSIIENYINEIESITKLGN